MRKAFIKELVEVGLRNRMTNAEMVAAHPQYKAKSIIRVANRKRKALGVTDNRFAKGPGLQIPLDIRGRLDGEAALRNPDTNVHNAHKLVLQLLRIIVSDNLFNAILGEPA